MLYPTELRADDIRICFNIISPFLPKVNTKSEFLQKIFIKAKKILEKAFSFFKEYVIIKCNIAIFRFFTLKGILKVSGTEFCTNSYKETEQLGSALARAMNNQGFVAFFGDLGAGKTAFIRGMGSEVCPNAQVCSPTYSVINEYRENGKTVMCHVDAYRIKDDDDLYSTGFYDCADYPHCIMAVEWSENIPFAIPEDAVIVEILKSGENERRITVKNAPAAFYER